MPIRSIEYGERAVQVVVLGQLTRRDVELIQEGLARGQERLPLEIDLRQAPALDAGALLALATLLRQRGTRVGLAGISRTSERLLTHLGVDLAAAREP